MRRRFAWLALILVAGAAPRQASAGDWTFGGELGLESRLFQDDRDGRTEDQALGLLGRFEARHRHGIFTEKLRGFGRLDLFDRERDTLIAEEAWVQAEGERLRLRLGLDLVNWSAMEAFHPADVLNARNLDSDVESFEKIGEPMASLQVRLDENTAITVLDMPVYTESRFPSPRSRLNFAPPGVDLRSRRRLVDRNGALADGDLGPQAAIQLRKVVGSADLAVHLLEHMDRLQPWRGSIPPVAGRSSWLRRCARRGGPISRSSGRRSPSWRAPGRRALPARRRAPSGSRSRVCRSTTAAYMMSPTARTIANQAMAMSIMSPRLPGG